MTSSITSINHTFKDIIFEYYNLYLHTFDDNLRNKLKQLLDSDDVCKPSHSF